MPTVLRLAVGAAAGVAVAAGFPTPGSVVLLAGGLIAFVAVLTEAGPRTGAAVGLAFGLGFMVTLLSWLRVLGVDAWLLLALLCACFYALLGWALALVARLPLPLLWSTACWVGMEYLRSSVPFGGFPWGRLAFATAGTPVVAWTRWLGVPATSGLVFAGCAAVGTLVGAELVTRRSFGVPQRVRRACAALAVPAAVVGVSLALPVGLVDPGAQYTVATVQGDVPGTGAQSLGDQHQVTANHAQATLAYASEVAAGLAPRPDLVLWPENSTDIDPFTNPDIYATIDTAVHAIGVPTLVGVVTDGPGPREAQNVAVVWDPVTGPQPDRYVKRHLVPFGEYIPFRNQIAPFVHRLDQIPRDMVPGDAPGVLQVGPVTVGTMMCFDVAYDDTIRDDALNGAQLMVVQTNNATYFGTDQPEQQWGIERVRAVETGHDLAVSSVNGISGFVAADGSVLQRTHDRNRQVLVQRITTATGVTLGVRLGGWIEDGVSLGALGAVVAALLRRRRSRRRDDDGRPVEALRAPDLEHAS